jgi:hypothetical protein
MADDVAIGATAATTVATTAGITGIHRPDGRVATGVEATYRRQGITTIAVDSFCGTKISRSAA